MIKSYSISTSEIDDPSTALAQILGQAEKIPLLKHTVGILVCHYDFVTNGTVAGISGSLPFPVVGITTFYQAASAASGLFELTITLLTSDDVRFAVASSAEVAADMPPGDIVRAVYDKANARYGQTPAMIMSFLSTHRPITGDEYMRLLDACSGGVPGFGAVSAGEDEAGTEVYVIGSDGGSPTGFALLMMIGDVKAGFCYGSFDMGKLLEMTATVTRCEGVRVYELNGHPANSYLLDHGIILGEGSTMTVPFYFKAPGSSNLISRTLGGINQDGSLEFFAEIPQGAILRAGTVSIGDILDVSHQTISRAVEEAPDAGTLLCFSCVGRYVTLGLDTTSEMDHIITAIPPGVTYLACYAGGEICPVPSDGGRENCYHNSSFVVCALS